MRQRVGERHEGLLARPQRPRRGARGDLGRPDRQLALEDERVGAAVDDREILGDPLEARLGEPVVEARLELHLHRHLALGAADDPDQVVVRMAHVPLDRDEIHKYEHAALGAEGRLEHVRLREVPPRRLVLVPRRNPEEAALAPVEEPREDRPRLEAVERAPVDRAVERDERRAVAIGEEPVRADRLRLACAAGRAERR